MEQLCLITINSCLNGRFVAITGRLSQPRAAIISNLKAAGVSVSSTVSKKTDYLIVGIQSPEDRITRKMVKAEQLGIKMLPETEIFEFSSKNNLFPSQTQP